MSGRLISSEKKCIHFISTFGMDSGLKSHSKSMILGEAAVIFVYVLFMYVVYCMLAFTGSELVGDLISSRVAYCANACKEAGIRHWVRTLKESFTGKVR